MFSLRNMLMLTIFCVILERVASEWKPYNGLWYYISEDNDTLSTYEDSKEKCKLLNGRLAALSGWPYEIDRLANFTGSTERWISAARVIHECDHHRFMDLSGVKFNIRYDLQSSVNKSNRYEYICDWQCHSLGVYIEAPHDNILKGVYGLNAANSDLRRSYDKRPHINSSQIRIFQKYVGNYKNNDHEWCFEYNNESYACKPSSHFTPYNEPNTWMRADALNSIHFFCHDCWKYEVSLRNESIKVLDTLYETQHDSELVVYTSSDDNVYLEYNSSDFHWCLTWTPYLEKYRFDYLIAPTVNYTIEYVSSDLDVVIYLSCTSTTIPVQQSTVDSMESETTVDSNVILAETTASSAISSVTNSQTANTVTDEHGLPTKESRSDDVRSENKIAMYIAIACAIGGVVIIIFISLAVVCCRRRMKNKRKPDTEQSIQNNMRKSKANIYSVDTQSTNYIEFIDSSIVVENKTGKANSEPLYEQAKDPTTENVYSEAEAVDSNIKQMYINGDFVLGSSESQNEAGSHTSDMKTGNKTADDGSDSETEFFNNNIYEGNVNMDRKNAEVPQPVPVKSPSGSDIEMYNNTLYEASGKGIAQNNKSELVKNMDSVDEDIEMYDNDLYGS